MSSQVIPDPGNPAPKKQQVAEMFDRIAGKYDFLNHFLSLGIDRHWRKVAVKLALTGLDASSRLLDIATGTADLAIEAAVQSEAQITGVDISENMLQLGRNKVTKLNLDSRIQLQLADSEELPFATGGYDSAMVAFGVRNFANLDKGMKEIFRVLKPGARAVVLEFSRPWAFPFKQIYSFYFAYVLPRLGAAVSKDAGAYAYLHRSVSLFPDGVAFLQRMQTAGFTHTKLKPISFGICTVYTGIKPHA